MKRKENGSPSQDRPSKRIATSDDVRGNFREDLFQDQVLKSYRGAYQTSKPYKHGVIDKLINDSLLRAVRREITENISFTPKETDIYKIHQSGDLANLDGLDESSLALLPSLAALRDAMYSAEFRAYLSDVTGSGPLSGKKTDMAVNVYTPGCHLLCHDDVIGTRRVSYILYLTDPDRPWRAEWGGALRLYETETHKLPDGETFKVPHHTHTLSIPPAFGQLSFFAVQPGESFHDVEEVYARKHGQPGEKVDGGRIRMAISGWFHIPQKGEDGYEPGAEATAAKKSSLSQLQGKSDRFDAPQAQWIDSEERAGHKDISSDAEDVETDLSVADLNLLVRFLNPQFLIPDTVAGLADEFSDGCSLHLAQFLKQDLAAQLRQQVAKLDTNTASTRDWTVAVPPHKHRYLFSQVESTTSPVDRDTNPLESLYTTLFPSLAFRKWLALATGLSLGECAVRARRFRRGADYGLAMPYDAHDPQLEVCLGVTPSTGWEPEETLSDDGDATRDADPDNDGKGSSASIIEAASQAAADARAAREAAIEGGDVGGYEAYMASDEPDEGPASNGSTEAQHDTTTGAGDRRSGRRGNAKGNGTTDDPAVYNAGNDADDDGGILFSMPAGFNLLSVVLRDRGTMRFVKYVSEAAKGDRWDVVGEWKVEDDDSEDDDDDNDADGASEEDDVD